MTIEYRSPRPNKPGRYAATMVEAASIAALLWADTEFAIVA
ncbi:MAG: hypothetical protein AAF827_19190 [Cyanobacteria bacterium P01_D01_bin.6]